MTLPPGGTEHGSGGVVQFGRGTRRYRRWPGSLLVLCLLVAAAVVVIAHSGSHRGAASPPPVTVTSFGHPILGVRGSWQLIGLDGNGIVAVQFAAGREAR